MRYVLGRAWRHHHRHQVVEDDVEYEPDCQAEACHPHPKLYLHLTRGDHQQAVVYNGEEQSEEHEKECLFEVGAEGNRELLDLLADAAEFRHD